MSRMLSLVAAGLTLLISEGVLPAQNVCLDYVRNVPRQYGPRDPWEVGVVMRNQIGHGGLFYNCDCEEHKRLSPYIRWEQQPVTCCPHGHCWQVGQQVNEVGQRVRTGACKQCEFKLCPQCRTSIPPVPSPCDDSLGGNCPCAACTQTSASPSSSTHPAESVPATHASAAWYRNLYGESGGR